MKVVVAIDSFKGSLSHSTYGVGEMITDAIQKGCRNFIIGIGGSATNDGGIGMLKALGFRFLNKYGNDAGEGGQALGKIFSIKTDNKNPLLETCHFQVVCDVQNPLCGKNGATYIYGPQKGDTDGIKDFLDSGMKNYAERTADALGTDFTEAKGAGAAGGLGFAFLSYLNATLSPGIHLVMEAVRSYVTCNRESKYDRCCGTSIPTAVSSKGTYHFPKGTVPNAKGTVPFELIFPDYTAYFVNAIHFLQFLQRASQVMFFDFFCYYH